MAPARRDCSVLPVDEGQMATKREEGSLRLQRLARCLCRRLFANLSTSCLGGYRGILEKPLWGCLAGGEPTPQEVLRRKGGVF